MISYADGIVGAFIVIIIGSFWVGVISPISKTSSILLSQKPVDQSQRVIPSFKLFLVSPVSFDINIFPLISPPGSTGNQQGQLHY